MFVSVGNAPFLETTVGKDRNVVSLTVLVIVLSQSIAHKISIRNYLYFKDGFYEMTNVFF